MLIFPPQLEIDSQKGFDGTDLFNRESFGKSLANLVTRSSDPLVIALDAAWGEGKTTFIKQWQGLLASEPYKLESIYFDAFECDYYDDPLVALASEVYGFISKRAEAETKNKDIWNRRKNKFLQGAKKWGKVAGRVGLRVGVRAATAGFCSLNDVEGGVRDVTEKAADAATDAAVKEGFSAIEGQLDEFLSCHQDYKDGLSSLHNTLKELSADIAGNEEQKTPLVFIIDELDRCRPDFALDLLEKIKHVFSVPGLVFVLAYNGNQLEEHIKCRYGAGVNAKVYLNKFVNLTASFPRIINRIGRCWEYDEINNYIRYLFRKMKLPQTALEHYNLELFSYYISLFKMSLRDVERVISYIALYLTSKPKGYWFNLVMGLCLMKVRKSSLFELVVSGSPSWNEVKSFFMFESLPSLTPETSDTLESYKLMWSALTALDRSPTDEEREWLNDVAKFGHFNREDLIKEYARPFLNFLPS